jgi:hypothetical protein
MNTAVTVLLSQPAALRLRPWLARAGTAVWQALEQTGRARAQRHLLDFASHCEALQPELAKELRAAAMQGPLG